MFTRNECAPGDEGLGEENKPAVLDSGRARELQYCGATAHSATR